MIKQADDIERILCRKFTRFIMQRSDQVRKECAAAAAAAARARFYLFSIHAAGCKLLPALISS